nr:hypothetical protein Q903MT_gene5048 [Picea sitchensis]
MHTKQRVLSTPHIKKRLSRFPPLNLPLYAHSEATHQLIVPTTLVFEQRKEGSRAGGWICVMNFRVSYSFDQLVSEVRGHMIV